MYSKNNKHNKKKTTAGGITVGSILFETMEEINQKDWLYQISSMSIKYNTCVQNSKRIRITTPEQACKIMQKLIDDDIELYETVWCIMLNANNAVLGILNIGSGSTINTTINIKKAMAGAILSNAVGIIICHNHPSGNPTPSKKDIELTKNFKRVCEILGIKLLDHIIITAEDCYSFDKGNMMSLGLSESNPKQ